MTTSDAFDVLVVGGGAAGLRAAIAVAEFDPSLRIGLASKVYPMRSHTVSAEGGAAGLYGEDDSHDLHCYDTIKGSDFTADQDVVETFVSEAPGELTQLEHWGCPWSREPNGKVALRVFGGMSVKRTWFAADKTGFHMLHTLFQTSLKYEKIERFDEWFVSRLLVKDGAVCGVSAVDVCNGRVQPILAKAVVLATGGAGRIFPFTTNGAIKTGDGMAMAYRAGVPLKDMEFVQYHPTGLPGSGTLMTEACRSEGGYLLNKDGDRFLKNYVPKKMELGPRDILSRAIMDEFAAGRGIEGPYGFYVHLDLRHLGQKLIDERLPFVRELATNYIGIDPVTEPIPVRPVVHYMMGGVDTDVEGATCLPGLYAAGEVACVSLNGGNRLGSNSLTECLVFGRRAGLAAAQYARERGPVDRSEAEKLAREEESRISEQFLAGPAKSGKGERVAAIRRELQGAMEAGAGVYRTEADLRTTGSKVEELRERFKNVTLDDRQRVFNTELTSAMELDFMLDLAHAIVLAAIERKESRGAHTRRDHTSRNDSDFLTHSIMNWTEDGPEISYRPATITRWQPEERKY